MPQTPRPRFGIMTAPSQVDYHDVLRVWRQADTIPEIEHAWLFDHLMPIGGDPSGPTYEGWTRREPDGVRRGLGDLAQWAPFGWAYLDALELIPTKGVRVALRELTRRGDLWTTAGGSAMPRGRGSRVPRCRRRAAGRGGCPQ